MQASNLPPSIVKLIDQGVWARAAAFEEPEFLDELAVGILTHEITPAQARAIADMLGFATLQGDPCSSYEQAN